MARRTLLSILAALLAAIGIHSGIRAQDRVLQTSVDSDLYTLAAIQSYETYPTSPEFVSMSPDGMYVYVTGYKGGPDRENIIVYRRDSRNGELQHVQTLPDYYEPQAITVSPDGSHVFVGVEMAVHLFARDATTGVLSFQEVTGITPQSLWPRFVGLSPDGKHAYVAADWIGVFDVDVTGRLDYVEVKSETGQDAASGKFGRGRRLVVTPDGAHVYTAGLDGLGAFSRDPTTGKLTYLGDVEGATCSDSVAVSPDGNFIYAPSACEADETQELVVFSRNASTGALSEVERHKNGRLGVNGLGGANCVLVTPDGRYIIVSKLNALRKHEILVALDSTNV